MKVILSRKGFDSTSGGHPSPVFPDGTMLSIPIPEGNYDGGVPYSELQLPSGIECNNYYELMKQIYRNGKICINGKYVPFDEKTLCHLDPDLVYTTKKNREKSKDNWRGKFGQMDNWEIHLQKQGVECDSLFLFFGLFRDVEYDKNLEKYVFVRRPFHAIWGYMRVGKVYRNEDIRQHKFDHPHTHTMYFKDDKGLHVENAIYEAREHLELDFDPLRKGYDVFLFHENRKLTKPGESVSKWLLHDFMKTTEISCHKMDEFFGYKEDRDYFQSIYRGQEFVFNMNSCVEEWLSNKVFNSTVKIPL